MYNFEVEDWHTYFVSGANVLVHNMCMADPAKGVRNTGNWHSGSFDDAVKSLDYHFKKHGKELGAENVEQYLRKAEAFAKDLKGATKKRIGGSTPGVTRYYKNGKYIDLTADKKIISFGKQ